MIVVTGFMGAGKTVVGQAIAAQAGTRWSDSDHLISSAHGTSPADIIEQCGVSHFRHVEHQVIKQALGAGNRFDVLSLGGGAVETDAVRQALAGHHVVYITVAPEDHVCRDFLADGRPLFTRENVADLLHRRTPLYEEVATVTIAGWSDRPERLAEEALKRLQHAN